jgi:3-phosphoshikimate 1-carboxyvinyltransferase
MSELHILPANHSLRGTIRVPADKSISHRAAILGALADGDLHVENSLPSQTTQATVNCLRGLGAEIEQPDPNTLVIHGHGLRSLREPADVLFCEGSGTTMRLLAGICAGQGFLSVLDGTLALKRRPMARVVNPLREMGATILARDGGRLPPLAIRGGHLRGIDSTLPVASAQVKSALLFAGLCADAPTTVREPGPSRDHTERMLQAFGVRVEPVAPGNSASAIRVSPTSDLRSLTFIYIPADFSSAAFFIVAALLVSQSELRIERVGVNPTRTGLLDVLRAMGADIALESEHEQGNEPVADVVIRASNLRGVEVGGDTVVRMIDEFPILAVAATQAHGETIVRDAAELRVKESDRIATVVAELRALGARIEPQPDGFVVEGPTPLRGAVVDSHGDHRLAMALAVAGLMAEGEVVVKNVECIDDSFPGFAELMCKVGADLSTKGH